jgi:exodeoxyribonuclease VII small subunit
MARNKSDKSEKPTFQFETALNELDQLVEKMEQGDLTLEESLQSFERGVGLARACQDALKTAEQKVQILVKNNGKSTLVPFEDESQS